MRNFWEHLFWRTPAIDCFWKCSWNQWLWWNWETLKINIRNKWKLISFCFYFMVDFLWSLYLHTIFLWCGKKQIPNNKKIFILELMKRRSRVQEKNMSCECALNFDQWKTFSENCKPMRVWVWLVYIFTEDYCRLQLFSEFIQTQ